MHKTKKNEVRQNKKKKHITQCKKFQKRQKKTSQSYTKQEVTKNTYKKPNLQDKHNTHTQSHIYIYVIVFSMIAAIASAQRDMT